MQSYLQRLIEDLAAIEFQLIAIVETMRIRPTERHRYVFSYPHEWVEVTDEHRRLQLPVIAAYNVWMENVKLLLAKASEFADQELHELETQFRPWLELEYGSHIPATTGEAITVIRKLSERGRATLQLLSGVQDQLILVPDTNALLVSADPVEYRSLAMAEEFTFLLLSTVLAELDQLKVNHRNPDLREKARNVIRRIKGWRTQGRLSDGVLIDKNIRLKADAREPVSSTTLHWLDPSNSDDRIIMSLLQVMREYPNANVVLVTADINLQNKAEFAHLPFIEPPAIGVSET